MNTKIAFTFLGLVLSAAVAGAACSSKSTGSPPPSSAVTVTQHVSAAAGGAVADAAGTATLTIPGGSLKADTDITLATTAAETGTVSSVYDFGPDGTQFSPAASLVIKVPSSVSVPSGSTPTLATYDGTTWTAIAGSTFANGVVTGPVAHFSKFTVILVNGQAVLTNSCSDTVTNFAACGGDVTGVWNLTDFCEANASTPTGSSDGGCAGFLFTSDITPTGSVTFAAGGTYTQTAFEVAVHQTETIPNECLGSIGGKQCTAAAQNFANDGGVQGTCTTTGADCVCSGDQTQQVSAAKSGTWTTSGTNLTTDDGTPSPYCVKDGKIYVETNDSTGKPQVVIVGTKQ